MVQEVENKIKTTDEKSKDKPNDLDPKKWRDYEKQGLQFFSIWKGQNKGG